MRRYEECMEIYNNSDREVERLSIVLDINMEMSDYENYTNYILNSLTDQEYLVFKRILSLQKKFDLTDMFQAVDEIADYIEENSNQFTGILEKTEDALKKFGFI